MSRKIRDDATLKGVLKKNDIDPKVLKTTTGRRVRSDVHVETLRKRSK
jgi:hypothetical protein